MDRSISEHGVERVFSNAMDRVFSDSTSDITRDEGQDIEKGELEQSSSVKKQTTTPPSPPQPIGFWHPSLYHVRNHIIRLYIRTVLILSVFILAVLSIYWGSLFRVDKNLHTLKIVVVDFDGQVAPYNTSSIIPRLGPFITETTERINNSPGPHVSFVTKSPSEFNYDPIAVRQSIYDNHGWAAIIINANATTLLEQAVRTGNASYDPTGAAQVVWVQARDPNTHSSYIQPTLTSLKTDLISRFSTSWSQEILTNATSNNTSISRTNLLRAPKALSPAIGFTNVNLRPFGPATVTPAVSIGLIYLIILAFFSFTFFLPIHMKYLIPHGHPPLHFHQLIIWRWLATVTAYFFMSLFYSLISLAFQIPFSNGPASPTEPAVNPSAYGKATFVVYWLLNFVAMTALGLACENVAMFAGQPWTAMWLIFWVITNVATSFNPLELAPRFYYWGYAWPLHNVVEASRQILFDLHSRIGLNFGVLFTWCAINTMLFPIACLFMRWRTQWEKRRPEHVHKGR
jgi:hypothetical protein